MTTKRLLLVSSSSTHGTGYLEHCASQIRELFTDTDQILFVPHALADRDGYTEEARTRFLDFGMDLESLHLSTKPREAIAQAAGVFVGGGNTFRLLNALYRLEAIEPIRRRVLEGMPYLGTSAGSNVACPTIKTTNDMPIVYPPSFDALNLVLFQVNAHYLDAEPDSTHMGETRETRIREFHEENPEPVLGLREGTMLAVNGDRTTLLGAPGGKLFRRGQTPEEIAPGAEIQI